MTVCFSFLKRSVLITWNEQNLPESVHRWETNGLTASRYVQDINRKVRGRHQQYSQNFKTGGKLKSKYLRFNWKTEWLYIYNLYTSKVHTKFEIQLPMVIQSHRVLGWKCIEMCPARKRFHLLLQEHLERAASPTQRPSTQGSHVYPPCARSSVCHTKTPTWNTPSDSRLRSTFSYTLTCCFSFIWSRDIKVMTEFSSHECSIDSLLRNIFEILSISQCVVYKAGNIYLTPPLTFILMLWTINGGKKNYHSRPSKADYNFGSKVTERTTIMNHSVSTSNRMGSQQGLVLIRWTWMHSMDESCRFARSHSRSPWMKGVKGRGVSLQSHWE